MMQSSEIQRDVKSLKEKTLTQIRFCKLEYDVLCNFSPLLNSL